MSDRTDKDIHGALGTGCWRDFPRIVCWCVVVVVVVVLFCFLLCDGVGVVGGGVRWGCCLLRNQIFELRA